MGPSFDDSIESPAKNRHARSPGGNIPQASEKFCATANPVVLPIAYWGITAGRTVKKPEIAQYFRFRKPGSLSQVVHRKPVAGLTGRGEPMKTKRAGFLVHNVP